jgi:hypothetical protein
MRSRGSDRMTSSLGSDTKFQGGFMRFFALLLCLAALPVLADEDPVQLSVNISGGSSVTTNNMGGGHWYSIWCDGPIFYRTCVTTTSCTAVTTDPRISTFDAPVPLYMRSSRGYFAFLRVAAATVCHVYRYYDKG